MYCGGAPTGAAKAEEAPAAAPARAAGGSLAEPYEVASSDDLAAVLRLATEARARGDADEVGRLAGRLFLELGGPDRMGIIRHLVETWLVTIRPGVDPLLFARSATLCEQGLAATEAERFVDAAAAFTGARLVFGAAKILNPAIDLVALGAESAGQAILESRTRDAEFEDLLGKATALLPIESKRHDGVALLRRALAVLPEPPKTLRDKARRTRVQGFLAAFDAPPAQAGKSEDTVLPPEGALPPAEWNRLGEQLLPLDAARALVCFSRAAAGAPNDADHWLNKGRALAAMGAAAPALAQAYEEATNHAPSDLRGWIGLAATHEESNEFARALGAWDRVMWMQPENPVAAEHRRYCERALALLEDPRNVDAAAFMDRAAEFLKASEWGLGVLAYDKALVTWPRNVGALTAKGAALGRWAFELESSSPVAARHRLTLAVASLQAALAVDPTMELAKTLLTRFEGILAKS